LHAGATKRCDVC